MEFTPVQRREADEVAGFLTAEEWPFHAEPRPDGVVRLLDLDDGTPLFDLRVRAAARGRGAGTTAVRWLTNTGYVKEAHYREVGTVRTAGTTRSATRSCAGTVTPVDWAG